MGSENWRTGIDAEDYFGAQKKITEVAQRRPTISSATDLPGLGPGIRQSAIRITNFNDSLATYNGYYSALAGATNAPNSTEAFVGYVLMDDTLGGKQVFTGLTSKQEYTRVFKRLAGDPSTIDWSAGWVYVPRIASASEMTTVNATSIGASASNVYLTPPSIAGSVGDTSVWSLVTSGSKGVKISKQGIYTGYAVLNGSGTNTTITFVHPSMATNVQQLMTSRNLNTLGPMFFPFTFYTTVTTQLIQFILTNNVATAFSANWSMHITRIGDAV